MIILKLKNKEYLLKENINLNKKMIQFLISLLNYTKYIYNNFYYKLMNFKKCVINIVNVMDKLIHDISSNTYDEINISQVKLSCVHAIIDDMDWRGIGDCWDTSINLNIIQLLYYYVNNIRQIVIDFCLNTKHNLIKVITKIKNILNVIYKISIQNLAPISKKFNYNLINNQIHNVIEPLLITINSIL